jgi:predicted DNA-binding protein
MSRLHNFHIPLPEDVYRRLRQEAERLQRPATQIGRQAIEWWLKEQRRAALHEAISAYAQEMADTDADLPGYFEVLEKVQDVPPRPGDEMEAETNPRA